MDQFWQSVSSVGHAIGLMALLVITYGELHKRIAGNLWLFQGAVGVLFGLGAVLAMVDPIEIAPGVIADVRNVMVALSGPFGGPVSLVISAAISAAYRISLGGPGVGPSLVSGVAVVIATWAFMRLTLRLPADYRPRDLATLGVAACAWIVGIYALPWEFAAPFLRDAAGAALGATFVGVFILGLMLKRERWRMRAEERLRGWAMTDALTGLPNRRAFRRALEQDARLARRDGSRLALLMIDLDRFKAINDTFGHEAGDDALAMAGGVLRDQIRPNDFVARHGGEEFTVILRDTNVDEAFAAAERLRRSLELNVTLGGKGPIPLSASIGVAAASGDEVDEAGLLKLADRSLYEAKSGGRNCVRAVQLGAGDGPPEADDARSHPERFERGERQRA